MNTKSFLMVMAMCLATVVVAACGGDTGIDVEAVLSQPKAFVGADNCKMCHLEHYDSWRMTQHSRMTEDAQKNRDVIIPEWDEAKIRRDLAKLGDTLKVPADQIYIPKIEDVLYTNGSQWKQNYIIRKNGGLFIAPIQYNVDTHTWVNYNEDGWDKAPWLLKCGGCHATGVDLETNTFVEPGVSCEACHGKGSHHAALPKTAVFQKRATIINPAKLTMGVAVQVCGSCHNRGQATKVKDAAWPVGYSPGKSLEAYYQSTSFAAGDVRNLYANEFSKGHHQQYIDWSLSVHAKEGVTCTSCHYVHQLGMPPTRSQTIGSGSQQCFECHVILNKAGAHAIHSFANCIGCHMPRIARSAESGDIHSHVMKVLIPQDTIDDPNIPNACTSCHHHRDDDLEELQEEAFPS